VEAGLFIMPTMEVNVKVRRGMSVGRVANIGEDRIQKDSRNCLLTSAPIFSLL